LWELKGYNEVYNAARATFNAPYSRELTFDQFEKIGEVIYSAIKATTPKAQITVDQICEEINQDVSIIRTIFNLFWSSFPKDSDDTTPTNKRHLLN